MIDIGTEYLNVLVRRRKRQHSLNLSFTSQNVGPSTCRFQGAILVHLGICLVSIAMLSSSHSPVVTAATSEKQHTRPFQESVNVTGEYTTKYITHSINSLKLYIYILPLSQSLNVLLDCTQLLTELKKRSLQMLNLYGYCERYKFGVHT